MPKNILFKLSKKISFFLAAAILATTITGCEQRIEQSNKTQLSATTEKTSTQQQIRHLLPETPQGKIEVIDFFWYGCPHCADFSPYSQSYKEKIKTRQPNVYFVHYPAILGPNWESGAQLFFTIKELNLLDSMHLDIFQAVKTEEIDLKDEKSMAIWIAKHSKIAESQFLDKYNSLAVKQSVEQAKQISLKSKIFGTPSLVINSGNPIDPIHPKQIETLEDLTNTADKIIAELSK